MPSSSAGRVVNVAGMKKDGVAAAGDVWISPVRSGGLGAEHDHTSEGAEGDSNGLLRRKTSPPIAVEPCCGGPSVCLNAAIIGD